MQTHAINQTHLYALLIGAAVLLMSIIPMTAEAASRPSCSLTITTEHDEVTVSKDTSIVVGEDEEFEIAWSGKNADSATLNGDEIDVKDSEEFSVDEETKFDFVFKNGSRKTDCEVTVAVAEGSIETTEAKAGKPTIRGEADGLKKVTVEVYKEGSKRPLFTKKNISVKRGDWSFKSTKSLRDGEYEVRLLPGSTYKLGTLRTETLTIGDVAEDEDEDESDGEITVSSVPLLSGGIIKKGETKPISYLQVRNSSKDEVHITGFTVKQNGTADADDVITSLSTIDDKGGSKGTSKASPFKDGTAFVPTDATIAPGALKLFTIKATLDTSVSVGTNLKLDVVSVSSNGKEKGTFPIKGTTWVIN